MNFKELVILKTLLLFVLPFASAQEKSAFTLGTAIQSNMVIQQDKPLKVWGKSAAGDQITIEADWARPIQVNAGTNGNWLGEMPVPKAKAGDFKAHTIKIIHGDTTIQLKNILIGEVWLCSGQSNMEMTMQPQLPSHKGVMGYETEIPQANYPNIRLFKTRRDTSSIPSMFCQGKWEICSPATVGTFSGVAYYFGREIYKKLNLPIGLVLSAYGGASGQAFTAREVLESDSALKSKYLQPYLDNPAQMRVTSKPSLMYNKMIYPLKNLSIKGVLWYQGESNSHDKELYTKLCTAMLEGWRKDFRQSDLPFYFVQMTPYNWSKNDFFASHYAVFREAQEEMLKVKNTGMAVTMDVGDVTDIHPRKKMEVGLRLAKIALQKSYNLKNVQASGPQYKKFKVKQNQVHLCFDKESIGTGLTTKDGLAPKYFYIAGEDKVFYEAKAQINGKSITLTSDNVKNPIAVRYAFLNYPITNLQNREGFPGVPFRSDRWGNAVYK